MSSLALAGCTRTLAHRLARPSPSLSLRTFSSLNSASLLNASTNHRPAARPPAPSYSISHAQTRKMASSAAAGERTMRAVLVKGGKGDVNALYLGEAPVPELKGEGEVLVRVKAFGVNRMDILQRNGQYPLPPGAPEIMGVEFSGHVVRAGPAARAQGGEAFKEGDEVFGLALGGAYAEYIAVQASLLLHKPASLSHVQAAAIPENWLTAFQALRTLAGLQKGESVLIHAGASGVGLAAQQLARDFGAGKVYATAGSDEKVRFCEEVAGADKAFNYKACDWAEELAKHTGADKTPGAGSVDVIQDFVAGNYWNGNINSLKRDGRLIMQGAMGGIKVKDAVVGPIIFKRLRIEGSTLRSRTVEYQGKLVQGFLQEGGLDKIVAGLSEGGKGSGGVRPHNLVIHKVYKWEDIQEAHREMEANKNMGKIMVTIGEQ